MLQKGKLFCLCSCALSVQCCSAGCFRFLSLSFICAVLLSRLFLFFVSELYLCSAAQPAVFVFVSDLYLCSASQPAVFVFLSLSFICAVLLRRLFSFFVSELYLCSASQTPVFVFCLWALSVQCFSAGCFRFLSPSLICAVLLRRLFSFFVSELYLCSASQTAVFVFCLRALSVQCCSAGCFCFCLWALSVQCFSAGCFRFLSLSFICAVLLRRLFSFFVSELYLCSASQPAVFVFCLRALSVQCCSASCFCFCLWALSVQCFSAGCFPFFCLWALSVQCFSDGCFRFLSLSFICAVLLRRLFSFFVSELYLCRASQPAVFVFCLWALSVHCFSDACFRFLSLSFICAVLLRRRFSFFVSELDLCSAAQSSVFVFLSLSFIYAVLLSRLFSFFVSELYLCSASQTPVFVFCLWAWFVQCCSVVCFRFFASEFYLCSASQSALFVFRLWALSRQCCSAVWFRVSSLSFICAVLLRRLFSSHISFCVGIFYSCLRAVLGRSLGYIPALSLTVTAGYLATGRLATSWRQPIDRSLCTALQIQKAVSANL